LAERRNKSRKNSKKIKRKEFKYFIKYAYLEDYKIKKGE